MSGGVPRDTQYTQIQSELRKVHGVAITDSRGHRGDRFVAWTIDRNASAFEQARVAADVVAMVMSVENGDES